MYSFTRLFLSVLGISLSASVLLAPLIILSPWLNKRYVVRGKYWMWMAIAVCMCLPWRLPTVSTAVSLEIPETVAMAEPVAVTTAQDQAVQIGPVIAQVRALSALEIAALVWALGAVLFLGGQLANYVLCKRYYMRWSIQANMPNVTQCLQHTMQELGMHKQPSVYLCKKVPGPVTLGFFKNYLFLPYNYYTDEMLGYILKHELVHLKRRDIWYKLILMTANAVHWFNPLSHLMLWEASKDLELLCDDKVAENFNYEQRRVYGEVILAVSHHTQFVATTLCTGFRGNVKSLKERFSNLLGVKERKKGRLSYLCLILLFVVAGSLLAFTPVGAVSVIQVNEQAVEIPNGIRGIDVSLYQGEIDWEKVASEDIQFVMARASCGLEKDDNLAKNIQGARGQGLHTGAYHYGKFTDEVSMRKEAEYFLELLSTVEITCPVALDIEQKDNGLTPEQRTALCVEFMQILEQNGYDVMFYTYTSYLDDGYVDVKQLEPFGLWIANYQKEPAYNLRMWQYTSDGDINGIDGRVDINVSYGDLNQNKP